MAKVFTITEGLENLGALRTGGQGSVYKAKRGEIISAVKILPTPIHSEDENDKHYRDFQNEVSKLKKVNEEANPHVVKIISSGITESGSLPFIEMEFIEGADLEDLIKPPHHPIFTIEEAIKVAEQLSAALAHCHKVSIKHGDVKSNNVKFDSKSGNYILLDFGLSIMSDEQRRTSLRNAGAIEFMAPEQNDGEMLLQSDVYSFGIILFELLAGAVPFPLNSKSETARNNVMMAHMEQPLPDILQMRRQAMPQGWDNEKQLAEMLVPGWLLAVISRCLEKWPDNRFPSGVELHEAVKNSISSKSVYSYTSISAAAMASANALGVPPIPTDTKENLGAPAVTPPSVKADIMPSPPLPEKEKNSNRPAISRLKPILFGVGILIILFFLLRGCFAEKKVEPELVDSAAINLEKQRILDSVEEAGANAQRKQDSIESARVPVAPATKPNYNPAPVTQRSIGNAPAKARGKGKGHSKVKEHKKK